MSNELFLFKHQHFSHPCDSNPVKCTVFVLSPHFTAQMSCVKIIKIENVRDVPLPFIPLGIRFGYLDFAYWPIQSSKKTVLLILAAVKFLPCLDVVLWMCSKIRLWILGT